MIYDIFTYNGEADILEIRLNILNDYVDQFIIVEAPTTFSGKLKPLYYEQQKARFNKFANKIRYFVIKENYNDEERTQANTSPNTAGASHWKHEFLQKESIKKALTDIKDDDIVFIGDCDEIWNPEAFKNSLTDYKDELSLNEVMKLRLEVYTYYLNNRSSEDFYGSIVGRYKFIKNECLNHLRVNAPKSKMFFGWHFTSMGGLEALRRKLGDSYTTNSYWSPVIQESLEDNFYNNRDFLGRGFTYTTDESELPQYLLDNKEKYSHLWKK